LVTLIDQSLFKPTLAVEAKVFYLKMKADYFRYMSEFYTNEKYNKRKRVIFNVKILVLRIPAITP